MNEELNTDLFRISKYIAGDASGILAMSKAISQVVDDITNMDPDETNKDVLLIKYFIEINSGIDLLEAFIDKLSNNTKKLKETATRYHDSLDLTSG